MALKPRSPGSELPVRLRKNLRDDVCDMGMVEEKRFEFPGGGFAL